MNLEQLQTRAISAMEAYAVAASEYFTICEAAARKSHAYRLKQAQEFTLIAADTATKRTEAAKQALVDGTCEMQMLERNLAEAKEKAAKAKIDQLKTEISLLQSLLRLETADKDMNKFGQQPGA